MSRWIDGIVVWRERRRHFSEEWRFRRDRAQAESGSRRFANKLFGPGSDYFRRRRRETGADWEGLSDLLPLARFRRSHLLIPCSLILAIAMTIAADPWRGQALASLMGAASQRLLPSTPAGIVPVWFAWLTWMALAPIGVFRSVLEPRLRNRWMQCYALASGVLIVTLALLVWVAAMQLLLATRWPSDIVQGLALLVCPFAYVLGSVALGRLWWRDVNSRCPQCLQLLRMPLASGLQTNLLVDAAQVERVCMEGHGASVESRWGSSFHPGQGLFAP